MKICVSASHCHCVFVKRVSNITERKTRYWHYMNAKFIYITDCQFLAYLCNGLVPGVIFYNPLSYEANFFIGPGI